MQLHVHSNDKQENNAQSSAKIKLTRSIPVQSGVVTGHPEFGKTTIQ